MRLVALAILVLAAVVFIVGWRATESHTTVIDNTPACTVAYGC